MSRPSQNYFLKFLEGYVKKGRANL